VTLGAIEMPVLDEALLNGIIARAASADFAKFEAQLRASGYCENPVLLKGSVTTCDGQLIWSTDGEPNGYLRKACGNRRQVVCRACAERYQQDAFHLIGAGLRGGKGVPEGVMNHPVVFATFTAPSFGVVHTRRQGKNGEWLRCRPRRQAEVCPHGVRMSCGQVHDEDEPCLGGPICPQCFDYEAAFKWNHAIGELWRRTTIYLPRALARLTGMTQKELRLRVRPAYVKVAEYQHRGLVHAATEQAYLMAKVNRGEWTPPPRENAPVKPTKTPSFQLVASEWLHRQKLKAGDPDGVSRTIRDLEWRIAVVMDRFGPLPVDRIDFAAAEDLVSELCEERLEIERARELGEPLTETYVDPRTGRRHERRRRGLANSSIRKGVDAAERVLRDARKRGIVADVPDLKSAAPKAERASRSFLEPEQIAAVLRAADLIEAEHRGLTWEKVRMIRGSEASAVALGRDLGVSDTLIRKVRRGELWTEKAEPRNRNDVPRRVVVESLILAGIRISEFCGLDGGHVDVAAGRLRIPREATKTDAGERIVPMLPTLRERLVEHRLDYPNGPSDPAFPTRNGTRQHPDNVRSRIVAAVHAKANELLAAEGRLPISHMTPHTLRRTFASILAACNVPPRRAMYLLGHTDPKLTLSVYQQVLDIASDSSVEALECVLGCTLAEACDVFNGRVLVANSYPATKKPSGADAKRVGEG
jgi:integrase